MKLKTLKDFGKLDEHDELVYTQDELKTEAIKWVKEEQKLYQESLETTKYKGLKSPRITMFMDFFNITEEDLK